MSGSLTETLKRTPLYEYYLEKEVKLVDFGGWALPVQFSKIGEEHQAVRQKAGLFDVSHMGEIDVSGEKAAEWLNSLVTNDVSLMRTGQAQYNTMTNEAGGTLDDLILFKYSDQHFLVTPNAGNTDKIWKWMKEHQTDEIQLQNVSSDYGLIALQGPKAAEILQRITDARLPDLKSYHFLPDETAASIEGILIARTGYTGEDGFELYVPWKQTRQLWEALLDAGSSADLIECGLGARDTLRMEAGMALYGQELTEDISPLEGGVGFAVKVDKSESFVGQAALKQQKSEGLKRVSRGFECVDKGIARSGYPVLDAYGEEIGVVTSGTKSPSLDKSIGMMLVEKEAAELGESVWIQVRKKRIEARITKKDWLKIIKQ
ncbi:glycine cleavage system aminomethyltransferase GcvT [Marinilactibacillus piezotolerans]|uniref:glycine cleavage system aminomethyltransferase GcvT n=1 Tax=Marinilactibacillus piezotolerans TaxID=258723 RepID=UPI0009B0E392|nr:glycine cleavage system aminomethyltransferase GcvT [Marinilactibacillus piezotolerans]